MTRDRALSGIAPAIAAVVVGGLILVVWARGRPSSGARPDRIAEVTAAAEELSRERPDLFRGFTPLSEQELAHRAERTHHGGLLLEPGGVIENRSPTFRWTPVPGVRAVDLLVSRADGTGAWSRTVEESTEHPHPGADPLEEGADYVWTLRAKGAGGPIEASRTFHVADGKERARRDEAVERLRALPGGVGRIAAAHWLVRNGWLLAAEIEVLEQLETDPEDPDALRLSQYLLARRGLR